jgi:hypothetical protein
MTSIKDLSRLTKSRNSWADKDFIFSEMPLSPRQLLSDFILSSGSRKLLISKKSYFSKTKERPVVNICGWDVFAKNMYTDAVDILFVLFATRNDLDFVITTANKDIAEIYLKNLYGSFSTNPDRWDLARKATIRLLDQRIRQEQRIAGRNLR